MRTPVIVQKYGGTSVGDMEKISHVAEKVMQARNDGNQVVVVVSAMGDATDKLVEMAHSVSKKPHPREFAVLVSTGEQVSMSALSLTLNAKGCSAKAYTGAQACIRTNSTHHKARIIDINPEKIQKELAAGHVVVVAGFQGTDENGDITTLGRGGSDTTAVALASALKADVCEIYTDVDGVYTADPRIVSTARRLDHLTFEEMLELSSLGAKVLQLRAVEFAKKYRMPIRVLSTFKEGVGTLITYESDGLEKPVVSGIAFNRNEAKVTILGVPDHPGVASQILGPISDAEIEIDMIIQNIGEDETTDFTFTVHRDDYAEAMDILTNRAKELGAREVSGDNKIAKLSLVGVGMRSHTGIANTMFHCLGQEGVNIRMITTSEIKISVVIDDKYLELGLRALHTAFGLDGEPVEEFDPN